MIDLGDIYPLSMTVKDASGTPEDATAVGLTITQPDLTPITVSPISSTTPGVYDHDYATVQAGWHRYRWVATGTNASVLTGGFNVEPSDPDGFISLADVNKFLKRPLDDPVLADWIGPACAMIRERVGHVSPVQVVEDFADPCAPVILTEYPVIEVVSVVALPGLAAIPESDPAVGTAGWTLKNGILRKSSGWLGAVRVTYRVGRTPVPPNYTQAGKELAGHLWRNSQQNAGGGRPPLSDDDTPVMPGAAFALPIRVRELLGLGPQQFGSEVLLA